MAVKNDMWLSLPAWPATDNYCWLYSCDISAVYSVTASRSYPPQHEGEQRWRVVVLGPFDPAFRVSCVSWYFVLWFMFISILVSLVPCLLDSSSCLCPLCVCVSFDVPPSCLLSCSLAPSRLAFLHYSHVSVLSSFVSCFIVKVLCSLFSVFSFVSLVSLCSLCLIRLSCVPHLFPRHCIVCLSALSLVPRRVFCLFSFMYIPASVTSVFLLCIWLISCLLRTTNS